MTFFPKVPILKASYYWKMGLFGCVVQEGFIQGFCAGSPKLNISLAKLLDLLHVGIIEYISAGWVSCLRGTVMTDFCFKKVQWRLIIGV